MDRRGFLSSFVRGAVVVAFRPDLLIDPDRVAVFYSIPSGLRPALTLLEVSNAITRKYFVPLMAKQLFQPTPAWSRILARRPTA
jgi:hypothetical protein